MARLTKDMVPGALCLSVHTAPDRAAPQAHPRHGACFKTKHNRYHSIDAFKARCVMSPHSWCCTYTCLRTYVCTLYRLAAQVPVSPRRAGLCARGERTAPLPFPRRGMRGAAFSRLTTVVSCRALPCADLGCQACLFRAPGVAASASGVSSWQDSATASAGLRGRSHSPARNPSPWELRLRDYQYSGPPGPPPRRCDRLGGPPRRRAQRGIHSAGQRLSGVLPDPSLSTPPRTARCAVAEFGERVMFLAKGPRKEKVCSFGICLGFDARTHGADTDAPEGVVRAWARERNGEQMGVYRKVPLQEA